MGFRILFNEIMISWGRKNRTIIKIKIKKINKYAQTSTMYQERKIVFYLSYF